MHPIHKHGSGMRSAERYDAKEAYNKKLSSKARMHYLENDIADHKGMSRYGSDYGDSAAEFNKSLKDASAKGKLDSSPKFKAIVDAAPSRKSSPVNYETAKQERKDLMKYNAVDDKAGMSRKYKCKK